MLGQFRRKMTRPPEMNPHPCGQGASPQDACEEAIKRLYSNNSFMTDEYQVGVLALRADGETGAFGLRKGFTYALCENGRNVLKEAKSLL